jgi:hypothetical protein
VAVPRRLFRAHRFALAGAALAVAALLLSKRDAGPGEESPILRAPLALPEPSLDEKLNYLFDRMRSGEELHLGAQSPALWRLVGQGGLRALGARAAAFLLDEARTPIYRADPATLANVMGMLPEIPGALSGASAAPFLLRWVEAAHAPEAPGALAEYAPLLLRRALECFLAAPDPRAAPLAERTLLAPPGVDDLRSHAVTILLRTGRIDALRRAYPSLPPNAAEPEAPLRYTVLQRLFECADPSAAPELHAVARAFEPELRAAAAGGDLRERLLADGVLLRLGDTAAGDRLVAAYRAHAEDDEPAALALDRLARAARHPFAYRSLFERYAQEASRDPASRSLWFHTSLALLSLLWPDDPEVLAVLWKHLEANDSDAGFLVPHLAPFDRDRVVAHLRRELTSGEPSRVHAAIQRAVSVPLPELGPAILALARRERAAPARTALFAALAHLRTEGALPLFADALDPSEDESVRAAAAGCLLDFGDREAARAVARALDRGDRAVLDTLVRRAAVQGAAVAPPDLVPPLLRLVRSGETEAVRRGALFVLRIQGDLEPVRDALLDAYRREPSGLVALEIAATLRDLAYRS